jgi:hypothetical protein
MRLDGVAYTTYVLITVFVPLKIWCRRRAGGWANVGLDDYLTVVALLMANGFFWTCMSGMSDILDHDDITCLHNYHRNEKYAWPSCHGTIQSDDDRRLLEDGLRWPDFLHPRHHSQQICGASILLAAVFS